jgi:hypothetical protein
LYYVPNINLNTVISKLQGICRTQSCDPPRDLEVIWGMSNTVVLRLRGVCCTQSCGPLCDLEITWGFKMSKLLNLIAYLLACLFTYTNWVLSCICERLIKHVSRIFFALFEMMPSEFIYDCLGWDRSFYTCGDLLNLLIHFISYLSS